jgi:putative membrane protein
MLVRNYFPFREIVERNWKIFIATSGYAAFISYLHTTKDLDMQQLLELPSYIPAVLGTSLAFFLGFITNSAYDRWWEARKKWGAIVNDSRNFGRQLLTFVDTSDPKTKSIVEKMVYRQIAWCYALKHQLRRQDTSASLQRILGKKDMESLKKWSNQANALTFIQSDALNKLKADRKINLFQTLQIERTMNALMDHLGACERIKNTIFPTQYSFFVHGFIIVFLILIPHGTVSNMGYWSVLLTFGIGFVYLMIETIEISMHDPFDMEPSDTPMSAICRTIEIDLMQMAGAKKVPKPVTPVDGILH